MGKNTDTLQNDFSQIKEAVDRSEIVAINQPRDDCDFIPRSRNARINVWFNAADHETDKFTDFW